MYNKATARPDKSKELDDAVQAFADAWIEAAQEDLEEMESSGFIRIEPVIQEWNLDDIAELTIPDTEVWKEWDSAISEISWDPERTTLIIFN